MPSTTTSPVTTHPALTPNFLKLKASATLAANAKAQHLKSLGYEVINLSVGELDFETPDFVKDAAKKALDNGHTRYTPVAGTVALKQAIINKFKASNNLNYNLSEVMASSGGKQILFNALLATLNPNDEVIIPAPYWGSFVDVVDFCGAKSVIVACDQANKFKLTADQLDKAITASTKWLILNSPSNPTGSIYSQAELEALAKVLLKHPQVLVLSDDIYEYLTYGSSLFYNLAMVEPALKERVLILNGVSKTFAMTGWRLGYAAGPSWLIKAITDLQSQSTSHPSSMVQMAAIAALESNLDFLKSWLNHLVNRRDFAVNALNKIEGLKAIIPEGAFYIYFNCSGVIGKKTTTGVVINDDAVFADYLLNEYHLSLVSGNIFGLSPYLRLSYAVSMNDIEKAMERLKTAVDALQ